MTEATDFPSRNEKLARLERLRDMTNGVMTWRMYSAALLVGLALNSDYIDADTHVDIKLVAQYIARLNDDVVSCVFCQTRFVPTKCMPGAISIVRPSIDLINSLTKDEGVPSILVGICRNCVAPIDTLDTRVKDYFRSTLFPGMRDLNISGEVGHG